MEKIQKNKNVIWNMVGATLNAFNSLLFTIVVTRINGITDAGIFTYSFATACLLYVIGVYLGRTFQVTDITNKYSDTDYIYNRILTCVIMIIVSILFCLIKQYEIYKALIVVLLCSFKAIEAFSESIYAIIQRHEYLDKVGKSLTIKALLGLVVFLVIDIITKNLIISCFSICIVNIIILITYDMKNTIKLGINKTKYTNKNNFLLVKAGFFTFLLTFLAQYIINSSRYAIDDLLTDNFQTIFGIIIMPATFMGLLGQFIIQPILTKISNCLKNNEYNNLRKLIFKMFLIVFLLGILVLIVVYFLGIPVLELIYGIELSEYFISLIIIIIGSILYCIEILISAILIAMRKTFGQAIMYLLVAIVSTILSYKLVSLYGVLGASCSYFITMLLISLMLYIYMIVSIRKYERKEKVEREN